MSQTKIILCAWWTSSNKKRAKAECNYFGIKYEKLIVNDKQTISIADINKLVGNLCKKYEVKLDKIICFDDNENIINYVRTLGIKAHIIQS